MRRRAFFSGTGPAGLVSLAIAATALAAPATANAKVLRVGTFHGVKGQYSNIQSAVDAAKKGDWILIAPGDYHEQGDRAHKPKGEVPPSGVLIRTPDLHLRGMNRNKVVVDGTKAGSPKCSSKKGDQDFGVKKGGKAQGRNGLVVYKADGVSIENLTACNFLTGAGNSGNEVWWNGGDGSGKIGLGAFQGNYLNATTTFYNGTDTAAGYGIFSSNADGPGVWAHDYASNFDDSNYYIGACQRVCNQTMNHDWSEYSALGYSGTNSGGKLIIKNSEFDKNKDGFDTNSQNNDDFPSPQDGRCKSGTSPITKSKSCWVFMHNNVHDNNNPQVPGRGSASAGPVGTGMSIAGGRFNTVMDNTFKNNGAWGVLLVPYPDDETPPPGEHCQGGSTTTFLSMPPFNFSCVFDDWGNQIWDNKFVHNGFFGNATNSDIGELTLIDGKPINCYKGNETPDGTSPSDATTHTQCGQTGSANNNLNLLAEAACDSEIDTTLCNPAEPGYPRGTKVIMHPLPTKKLATMPNPCKGVPSNPWCAGGKRRSTSS